MRFLYTAMSVQETLRTKLRLMNRGLIILVVKRTSYGGAIEQGLQFFFFKSELSFPEICCCRTEFTVIIKGMIQILPRQWRLLKLSENHSLVSLRGRRLKGMGKGVLGARETRGAREEGGRETRAPRPSPLARLKPTFPSLSNACHAGYSRVFGCDRPRLEIINWE